MKILYIPHELKSDGQTGFRNAFSYLKQQMYIEDVEFYPFLLRLKELKNWDIMLGELMNLAKKYLPDGIYWELHQRGKVPEKYTKALKNLDSCPVICQSNGDSHFSPVPEMIEFGKHIDITYLAGTGQSSWYKEAGCRIVRLMPHFIDEFQYNIEKKWPIVKNPEFNIVMIANAGNPLGRFKITHRGIRKFPNPVRPILPYFCVNDGRKERFKLVKNLSKRYGNKFAVYGQGWERFTRSAKGILPYNQQIDEIRNAWCSVGTNNWNYVHNYFSDRPFFAMFSGIPYISRYTPGLENFFKNGKHCFYYKDFKEIYPIIDRILDNPTYFQKTMASSARELVIKKHKATDRALQIVNDMLAIRKNPAIDESELPRYTFTLES